MFNLEDIKDPSFIKQLNKKELITLADEIREFIISNVAQTGGHLASNLGVVEITLAMHYVFDSPKDKFLFDVGHQMYAHKILTGRAKDFKTLRSLNGLSGYASKSESIHDIWESGHSSTSISAQAGLIASQIKKEIDGRVIALIGDSSIANGIAFEGLNFEGQYKDRQPIIILNDNKMGINRSVGAMNKFLNRLRSSKGWRKTRGLSLKIFPGFINRGMHQVKRGIKGFIQKDNIFEDLGFDYYGPYEGNNVNSLIRVLKHAKKSSNPTIIHIITKKGKGYKPAEDNMTKFHGVDTYDLVTGISTNKEEGISYTKIAANELLNLHQENDFSVICPAMISSTHLTEFKEKYPSDCYDVGIAEEHATVMAAGMALGGENVVLPMYSTFSQRAFDQMLNDVCRQNLNVKFMLDRCGVVGKDGSTHQGVYDISMLSLMPNMKIAMGRDGAELKGLIEYAIKHNGPIAVRYPKLNTVDTEKVLINDEKWQVLKEGSKGIVISYGPDLDRILKIISNNNLDLSVINARFIRPLDEELLNNVGICNKSIFIYEQVIESSSLAMMIRNYMSKNNYTNKITNMSFDTDQIVRHGNISEVLDYYGLGDKKLEEALVKLCQD